MFGLSESVGRVNWPEGTRGRNGKHQGTFSHIRLVLHFVFGIEDNHHFTIQSRKFTNEGIKKWIRIGPCQRHCFVIDLNSNHCEPKWFYFHNLKDLMSWHLFFFFFFNPVAARKEQTCQLCWDATFICWEKNKRPFTVSNCIYTAASLFFLNKRMYKSAFSIIWRLCKTDCVYLVFVYFVKIFTNVLKYQRQLKWSSCSFCGIWRFKLQSEPLKLREEWLVLFQPGWTVPTWHF